MESIRWKCIYLWRLLCDRYVFTWQQWNGNLGKGRVARASLEDKGGKLSNFCKIWLLTNSKQAFSTTWHFIFRFQSTITHKIFEANSKYLRFSCEIAHNGKSLISVFQEFPASVNKTFILAERQVTRLSFYEV